jgi:amino acid adenylation domain-containing protein
MATTDRFLSLPPEKRALLERLMSQRAARIQRRPPGMMRVPASYGQRRIWFLDRLEPGLPLYQISTALPVDAALDPARLERSLNALVERHESLRTTFTETEDELVQIVAPRLELALRFVDLRGLPVDARAAEARRIGAADAAEPFDLGAGPLVRATLVRLGEAQSVVLLTLHHIIADGWSMDVLLNELSAIYEGAPSLSELPIQYADYALWQRQHLTADREAAELDYWKRQLADLPKLRLPVHFAAAETTYRGAREFFRLDAARTSGLGQIARETGATLFMTLLAAFQVLLARYSGQDDIVVGLPVAGRTRPETEGLIGFFLNTLCLRTSLAGEVHFCEVLERARQAALGAYAHQELPFERVVEALAPGARPGAAALFNVMFVLQAGRSWGAGGALESQFESGTAKFDLTLSMLEAADGLAGALEYNTDLFRPATARRMVRHFEALIDAILASPRAPVASLDILSGAERRQILHEWNATGAEFPDRECVQDLITGAPGAAAVISDDGELTYAELDGEANRVANMLVARGVRPGDRVGILLKRGLRLLPALLGVWKAGCAYVPLDPDAPPERTRFAIDDAELAAVLTEELLADAAAYHGVPRPVRPRPEDAAYIIYTSGSTGTPKGVVVEHRSLVNYLTWLNRTIFSSEPRLTPATSKITFDASLKQLFAPLLRGDSVWLISEPVVADLPALVARLGSPGDYTLNCVPWLWNALLHDAGFSDSAAARGLKRLLIGGEELGPRLLERTFARFPALELWNLYGPTEATANATAARLRPGDAASIGRPVANTVARVLDGHGRLTPAGVAGELHIGGMAVARGYWSRPELTAERFVPDPFAESPGARLYRTGDLVRYRDDGSLEYLGRIDRQIKLHGYRIEPGEVEAVLARHPAVEQAAVVLAGSDRAPRLAAYITPRQGAPVDASALRRFAAGKLPEYMVPAAFVFVDSMPRGAHGKLDLAALPPAPDYAAEDAAAFVGPRDDDERRLAAIWEALLDRSPIGIHAGFFELGGHSLLATQVVSRIRQAFDVEVPLRAFFETPTIESLAVLVRRAKQESPAGAPIRRIDRAGRRIQEESE